MPFGAVAGAVVGGVASAATSSLLSDSGGGGGSSGAAAAADPFASQRKQYQDQLSALLSDPSSITKDPGYAFGLDQALKGVQGSAAANGMLNSGNTLAALQDRGQSYASTALNNKELLLAQLAGANVGSPGTAGQILANQANVQNQGAAAIGQTVGNAVSSGVNSYFGGSGYSGGNPFASGSGYGVGGNTYGFTTGASDPSYGVSGGYFGG